MSDAQRRGRPGGKGAFRVNVLDETCWLCCVIFGTTPSCKKPVSLIMTNVIKKSKQVPPVERTLSTLSTERDSHKIFVFICDYGQHRRTKSHSARDDDLRSGATCDSDSDSHVGSPKHL